MSALECPLGRLAEPEALANLRAFAEGTLSPDEAQRICAHLEVGCERCEQVFASEEAQAAQRAMSRRVVASLPAPRPGELNAVFLRIDDAIGFGVAPSHAAGDARRAPWWRLGWWPATLGIAFATVLCVPVALWILSRDVVPPGSSEPLVPPLYRDKSVGVMSAPELRFYRSARRTGADGAIVLLDDSQPLHVGDAVLFRVSLSQAAHLRLVIAHEGKAPAAPRLEALFEAELPAGEHEVAAGGHALAYITEQPGEVRFRLAVGQSAATAQAAARNCGTAAAVEPGACVERTARVIAGTGGAR